ncbi:MAG: glycosyltransferase family 4 protein [Elusimicrobiota bacterium]
MRVLHIIDEPYDSGIVQYALKVADGMRRRGHESRVWGLESCFPVREAERLGLPAAGYTHPWLNLPTLRRRLREDGIELLVAHTGSSHTLGIAVAAWHGPHRIPVIRTRGDARPLKPRPGRRLQWKNSSGFIAANRRILEDHLRLYNGMSIPAELIYEGSADPGEMLPPAGGAPTVGIVGRLDPVKGHAIFLEAAAIVLKSYPDARFIIVGRQENITSGDLLRQAHALSIAERVELTGHVPKVADYMQRCHIGVIASLGSEAVSRAAVEWMAVGRPLVATRVGCLPEYVVDGETGQLVNPRDPQALAAALGRLIGDSFLREQQGRAARTRFTELFTLDRFLDQTERFYERTLQPVSS